MLAIDVDGTLMDSNNALPAANRDALHRAHEAGLTVCLCTGRAYRETKPVIDAIGLDLDAAVCVFGAVVSEARTGRTLHRQSLPRKTALRLMDFFGRRGHPMLILHDATEAGVDYYFVPGRHNMAFYERWLEMAPTAARRVDRWPAEAPDPLRITVIETPDRVDAFRAELTAAFPPTVTKCNAIYAPNYGLHVLECFAPEVNKWFGLSRLAEMRGIRPAEIVAIGDDVNDLEMIRMAGLGVAMGNAIPAVHSAARCHTATNDEAGVAALINRLLTGESLCA